MENTESADGPSVNPFVTTPIRSETVPNEKVLKRTLTTFSGVFCPVALAQFSTVLFLRIGFVVGQIGIIESIIQLFLAYALLYLTILSICAISTNGAVEGGGVYFMISRTLGPEFGGSIGILFFLGQVFSCALYVSGFVEAMMDNFGPGGRIQEFLPGDNRWYTYLYSTVVTLICFSISLIGGSLFAKTSLFILVIVMICYGSAVVSFCRSEMNVTIPRDNKIIYNASVLPNVTFNATFTGFKLSTFHENAFYHPVKDYSTNSIPDFVSVFAVLFAGVTGIMNGANMSGELKKPSVAIPRGTIAATSFCLSIYLITSIFTAGTCSKYLLVNNYIFMQGINYWRPFIVVGIFATTLSASLGNLIGGSRILQALAKDEIFGVFLRPAKWTTSGGNPVVAVLITFILVQLVYFIGSLNSIAPAASVLFLLSYACVNLACLLLDVASPVNFRPTFKWFSWYLSLIAMIGCVIMCFLINAIYTCVILSVFLLLIIGLQFRNIEEGWGSIGQALIFHQVRKYLLKLDSRKDHVKYWRPQILLMIANARSSASLVQFINDLKKGGLYILGHVVNKEFDDVEYDPCAKWYKSWLSYVDYLRVKAFVEITMCSSVRYGLHHLCRISGIGGMKPNVVCLGFYDDEAQMDTLSKIQHKRRTFEWSNIVSSGRSIFYYNDARGKKKGVLQQSAHSEISLPEAGQYTDRPGFSRETTPLLDDIESLARSESSQSLPMQNLLSQFPPVRSPHDEPDDHDEWSSIVGSRISSEEYVALIADTLKLEKDICLCRHFAHMNREELQKWRWSSSRTRRNIDVWPVNFFQPRATNYLDTSCLFILQLACILRMVPAWKTNSQLRVFLCVDAYTDDAITMRTKLNNLLSTLRISAEVFTVSWDDIMVDLESSNPSLMQTNEQSDTMYYREHLPDTYIEQVNQLIQDRSKETAVTFLYLPRPPLDRRSRIAYLRQLTLLTDGLSPTVLAHGMHSVTSTML